jgi:beta-glucanase (GH16 family)
MRSLKSNVAWAAVGAVLAASAALRAQFAPVWSDEFSGTSVSGANWFLQNQAWPYNAELQYYLPQQASVSNGELVITTTNQPFGGRLYRSARLESVNRRYFLYGRFEMRARLPGTQGIWPAFWLLPQDGNWPPEIDIMEFLGHDPTRVYATNHWPIPGQPGVSQSQTASFVGPNFMDGYNTFRCDWWPDRIEFYVNDQLFSTNRTAVPQVPMFILLNTAVGGNWPGNPNASTVFPQYFRVDWVRVSQWQRPLLKNPGAEYEGTATRIMHWQNWGNLYASESLVRTGRGAFKTYGNFSGPNNSSGAFQDLLCTPGEEWSLSAWVNTPSWDKSGAGNYAYVNIEWRNASGSLIRYDSQLAVQPSTPANSWREVSVTGVAPAGAATARAVLIYIQGAQQSTGAVWWDDLSFAPTAPVCDSIDFNNDGVSPDTADVEDLLAVFGGGACSNAPDCNDIDFNNDGVSPDVEDVDAFLRVYGGGAC